MTRAREGVACTPPGLWLVNTEVKERGNALGGPIKEVRRPLTGEGEVGSTRFVTGTGSRWLDCETALDTDTLVRFEAAVGGGTGVALGERPLPVAEVVSVVEVGDDDGFTVVHALMLLALDIARGFATLSEERVDVDRGIENRDRAEASEGTGMDGAGQQQVQGWVWTGILGVSGDAVRRYHERRRVRHCVPTPRATTPFWQSTQLANYISFLHYSEERATSVSLFELLHFAW